MDAIAQFLHMGGYAFYVWTAYAITTALLVLNLVLPLRRARRQRERLRRMLRTAPAAPAAAERSRS